MVHVQDFVQPLVIMDARMLVKDVKEVAKIVAPLPVAVDAVKDAKEHAIELANLIA